MERMPTKQEFIAAGFNAGLAEALVENDYTIEAALEEDARTLLDIYLVWNGILGHTSGIIAAYECARTIGK